MFASDAGIVIGWTHYLAFDLFVGLWIAKDADSKGFARWVQLPFLAATLFAGPIGLLAWLVTRERRARRIAQGRERALLEQLGERRPARCPGSRAQCRTDRRSACRLAAAKRHRLGSGERDGRACRRIRAAIFAKSWQPSDTHDERWLDSRVECRGGAWNVRPALRIDVVESAWPIERADAVMAINMVHIAPWAASLGLLDGAARLLDRGAPLILYGPWIERDVPTSPSNLAFDADLRGRNPQWGCARSRSSQSKRRGAGWNWSSAGRCRPII